MSLFSLTCEEFLFLAVLIFRHTIFGKVLIVVPDIFVFSIFFGKQLFLAMLLLAGMVTMQDDMWESQSVKSGKT